MTDEDLRKAAVLAVAQRIAAEHVAKKRHYTTYTPSDKGRLKSDVMKATADHTLTSRVVRVVTQDGESKNFEELTGLDGLTFGLTDFATAGGVCDFFKAFSAEFPDDFVHLFPDIHEQLLDEAWVLAHNKGSSGPETDDVGLITDVRVRKGLSALLANPKFRQFQITHFQYSKIGGPQRRLGGAAHRNDGEEPRPAGEDEEPRPGTADDPYGRLKRQFSVAALAAAGNSVGPGVAVGWFRDGLTDAGNLTGRDRETHAIVHMLRRYLQTADHDRELMPHPDGVAFLEAAVQNPSHAVSAKWNLGHRGHRVRKLFKDFDFLADDPVTEDILANDPEPPPAGTPEP